MISNKIYSFGYSDYEGCTYNLLINKQKEYSDLEYKELCAELSCIYYDKNLFWNAEANKEFLAEHPEVQTLFLYNDVYYSGIYNDVLTDLEEKYGFEIIKPDVEWFPDSTRDMMKNRENDDYECETLGFFRKYYYIYMRRKKLQRILK